MEFQTDTGTLPDMPLSMPRTIRRSAAVRVRRLEEETINALTHGCGFVLSGVGAVHLVQAADARGSAWFTLGCLVYAASLMAVYAASTLSHAVIEPRRRQWFRQLDQAAIYLLIVGTYTPFALTYMSEGWWWLLPATMWVIALAGAFSKLFWAHRVNRVSVLTYLVLGWMPGLGLEQIIQHAPWEGVVWIFGGGVLYSVGTIFLILDRRARYFHAVWHLLVISGSACHYYYILAFLVPQIGSVP